MNAHSQDLLVQQKFPFLKGKSIAFCISAGIGAVETPKIIRELRRYGAHINVYAPKKTFQFIGKIALEWASTNPIVSQWKGNAPHIPKEDAVILLPATANTISKSSLHFQHSILNKAAHGIADDLLSTIIASTLGFNALAQKSNPLTPKCKPLLILPAMHQSLANNPFFLQNKSLLQKVGATFLSAKNQEQKLKIPPTQPLCQEIIHLLSRSFYPNNKKHILLTAGPVPAHIDPAREISNFSSGKTSLFLLQHLFLAGFSVSTLFNARLLSLLQFAAPDLLASPHLSISPIYNYHDYLQQSLNTLNNNPVSTAIFAAAVTDLLPKNPYTEKIPSNVPLNLQLVPSKKIVQTIRRNFPNLNMIVFKLSAGVDDKQLFHKARQLLKQGYQGVFANRIEETQNFFHNKGTKYFFSTLNQLPQKIDSPQSFIKTIFQIIK